MILKNYTLLYVEDDMDTQEVVSTILSDEVKELYIASNGQEGLESYKKNNPNIILTDINMPILSGLEMLKEIKEVNYYQPSVILTAFEDSDNLKEAIDLGVDKYIVKPIIDYDKLLDPLESIANILNFGEEKKALERIVQQQSKMAAIGDMIRNIIHQWRQPLASMAAEVSALEFKLQFNESIQTDYLKDLTKSLGDQIQYLSQTIDDFRIYFKQNENIKKEKILVSEVFNSTKSLITHAYKSHSIEIIEKIDNIEFTVNKNELIQVFINIFNNAKDALLNLEDKELDKIVLFSTKQENGKIEISIQDNAGGISDDVIERVFDPYFSTKSENKGTGLGLYISYEIITKHLNGKLSVTNETFQYNQKNYTGAKFTITLSI
jgi:signal transduction histidine kinase